MKDLYDFTLNGIDYQSLFDFDTLVNVNKEAAYERYFGAGLQTNFITQILGMIVYALPLCGGYCYNYSVSKRNRILCIITFIPITISVLTFNTKAGFIGSVFLWITGYILSYLYINGKAPKINLKSVLAGLLLFVFFLIFMYFSMLLRTGDFSHQMRQSIYKKLLVYIFGQMEAFDYWFTARNTQSYSLGVMTFTSVFMRLGLATRDQGVYGYYPGISSNVYTAFRGVIEDYELFGGQIFTLVLGLLGGYNYKVIKKSKHPSALSRAMLAAIYFYIFYGFIISPYIYSTYLFAFFVFLFFIRYANKKKNKVSIAIRGDQ